MPDWCLSAHGAASSSVLCLLRLLYTGMRQLARTAGKLCAAVSHPLAPDWQEGDVAEKHQVYGNSTAGPKEMFAAGSAVTGV